MSVSYFNSTGISSNNYLLYRMKPVPITTQLYGQNNSISSFKTPVYRAGASDRSFATAADTGVTLYTTSALGIASVTAAVTYTTYLTSAVAVAFHFSSADSCLYVLINAGSSYRLIKISDTTGAVTTIGASFTPTTLLNWPTSGINMGTMEVNTTSGDIQINYNGFTHSLNKTSGAIVTQDVPVTLGAYVAKGVIYTTQDGTVGITAQYTSALDSSFSCPALVSTTYGHISGFSIPVHLGSNIGSGASTTTSALLHAYNIILLDNDKVYISTLRETCTMGCKLYLRSDFDKYIKSLANIGTGVV